MVTIIREDFNYGTSLPRSKQMPEATEWKRIRSANFKLLAAENSARRQRGSSCLACPPYRDENISEKTTLP
jgi:hypothetical protein